MRRSTFIACATLLLTVVPCAAQEILLDQMVEVGGLKCYPVHGDATSWYYLPDQPHVAADDSGRPQFSFLMYSSPEQRGEEGITSAPGGGVAHMLVAYDVPEDMIRRAQSELQRAKPGAQLKGPAAYTDGTFNLVTAVTDPEAGLSRRVVGVGNAPVMSGHKAAVSMHLTPAGAMLLWESFSQRTPDISVNFEMTVSGYRNPVEAQMTFDYERIHRTMEIEAGIEASFIEADVDVMLGKMVDNGAISIELKGAPPEHWAEVQKLGLELAKHHLFENLGAAPLSQVGELARSAGSSRSTALDPPVHEVIEVVTLPPPGDEEREAARDRARDHFMRGVRLYQGQRYREALSEFEGANNIESHPRFLWNMGACHVQLRETDAALEFFRRVRDDVPEVRENSNATRLIEHLESADRPRMTVAQRDRLDELMGAVLEDVGTIGQPLGNSDANGQVAASAAEQGPEPSSGDRSVARGADERAVEEAVAAGSATTPTATPAAVAASSSTAASTPAAIPRAGATARRSPTPTPTSSGGRGSSQARDGGGSSFSISIAFRYRKIERSGNFTINMKQWNRVEVPVRFAANVGDLSRHMDDERVFRRVSLNDPMFKQREIPVTVDVASEDAFAAMLNAVTVTIKKRHRSGRETLDEVNIHRADFASGRMESLVYGWDGDDDRDAWLEYDHRVRWSYVGGPVIETGWRPTTAGALVLEPPLRPRELRLEADPGLLREQGVRDVVVEVRYPAGDVERIAHATVRPSDETGQQRLVLYQDPQRPEYSYSFDWRLYGGRRVEAGPFTDTADFIYLDEIPE
ncbi:MAG TPA: hypothetical protein VLB51_05275 [Methylomirabilota bacterium]|nr:hypothetical protein [Methylomirabilota bacterium]